jgi:hypothetical protein
MIVTGLPYSMTDMDDIKNNGAIVDMSNIHFPNIEESKVVRTTLLFLRNTGFDVKLDFSKCSYQVKEDFLLQYLKINIDINQNELVSSYIKIFNKMIGNELAAECILTDDEIQQFILNNSSMLAEVFQFIKSLPIFAMYYFSLDNEVYTLDDIEKHDEFNINNNFYNIISHPDLVSVFDNEVELAPLFYTNIFSYDNKKLLEAMQHLPFFSILYGLCTKSTDEWNGVLEDYRELENG